LRELGLRGAARGDKTYIRTQNMDRRFSCNASANREENEAKQGNEHRQENEALHSGRSRKGAQKTANEKTKAEDEDERMLPAISHREIVLGL
jgi:hypothetical protein